MSKNGLHLITPLSIAYNGGGSQTATIDGNGSVVFQNCWSVSLNGVFSEDYDNYMIVKSGNISSEYVITGFRPRSSGVDDTETNYRWQRLAAVGVVVAGQGQTSGTTIAPIGSWGSNINNGDVVYVYGPYLTQTTALRSVGVSSYDSVSLWDFASMHNLTASYDGFTLLNAVSEISGRIAVYGMRK